MDGRSQKKSFAVVTLFLVAPLVAEYLLGDLPLNLLPALVLLAPAYGGAAVLIRETARRTGRGWPTMLTLGAAYTFIGEGLVSQSLFNPDYLKMHMHLLDQAYNSLRPASRSRSSSAAVPAGPPPVRCQLEWSA
jgi:hypothetical protein